jgi:uncharacterized protein YgiM (DUF1202 family)
MIYGDPNLNYAELVNYLRYRMLQLTIDVIKEYQEGNRVPDDYIPCPDDPTPDPTDYLYRAKVLAYALNVRRGPSSAYPVVTHVKEGDVITVWEMKNSWARIHKMEQGWVFSRYIKQI